MIRFDIVRTVFFKELKEMLRDRRSLAVMFGLPLVLYPLVAIGIATLGQSRRQELGETPVRAVIPNAEAAPELFTRLKTPGSGIELVLPDDAETALARGVVDAIVVVPDNAQVRAIAGEPIEITVRLDRSRSISSFVEKKIDKVLDGYERWVLEQRLRRYDAPPQVLEPLKTTTLDIASGDKVFGRLLSQMLPLLLLMTGMLGALFPALNATTTERELGTLETLLVTPAGRTELLLAKGALVLISALLAAGLNVLSMSLVLLKALSSLEKLPNLTISPSSLLLSYLAAVPALIFFSVLVLIVGLLARNFREANSFATPVMLLPLLSLAVGISEPEATTAILITPVANTTVIIREVLTGRASPGAFALAFGSSCLYAGIVLSLAARVFSSEQLVNPAWEPVSLRGLRRSNGARPRRLPPAPAVLPERSTAERPGRPSRAAADPDCAPDTVGVDPRADAGFCRTVPLAMARDVLMAPRGAHAVDRRRAARDLVGAVDQPASVHPANALATRAGADERADHEVVCRCAGPLAGNERAADWLARRHL